MEFPDNFLDKLVEENTRDGNVVKVFCDDLKGQPKEKILVIVSKSSCNTKYGCIYINSDDYPYLHAQHILRSQQLPAKFSKYNNFLKYDSFFDCSDIQIKTTEEIDLILKKDPKRMLGKIDIDDHKCISDALRLNNTIKPKTLKLFHLRS